MTGRTTKDECPDCSTFDRCDYHEGKRHGKREKEREVRDLLTDSIESKKAKIKEVRDCGVEDCRYGMSEQEHEHSEISLIAAKRELQEVRRKLDRIDQG